MDGVAALAAKLEALVDNELLSDCVINLGEVKFRAHKVILAASSDFFRKVFQQDHSKREVRLDESDHESFRMLLRFIYCGRVELAPANAKHVLELADKYYVESLKRICAEFLSRRLAVDNCCNLMALADSFSCAALRSLCFEFIVKRFSSVRDTVAFLDLNLGDLVEMLLRDELGAFGEEDVFDAVVAWVRHREERLKNLGGILPLIKFPFMAVDYLQDVVEGCELFKAAGLDQQLKDYLYEAYRYHASSDTRRRSTSTSRLRRRHYGMTLVFVADFDSNGVFYWLGTSCGKDSAWKNPSDAFPEASPYFVRVTASAVGAGSPTDVLLRTPSMRDFSTRNEKSSWLRVDLPAGLHLRPTHYTLRNTRLGPIRSWIFQGTADGGATWVDLDVHEHDGVLRDKYHAHTFAIPASPDASRAGIPAIPSPPPSARLRTATFQSFRLVQSAPNADGDEHLHLSGLELYGHLTRTHTPPQQH